MDNFNELLEQIRSGQGIPGSVMEQVPSLLRGAFRAPDGYKFVASDYSQIELRVLAWLTDCAPMLELFEADHDLYIDFAAKLYNTPYAEVTKPQRQIAKPAVLSCGYGSGGGEWKTEVRYCPSCKGGGCEDCEFRGKTFDQVKSGLWGYAESMGVEMTQAQAHAAVATYRSFYPEVPRFWWDCEEPTRGLFANRCHSAAEFAGLVYQLVPGKLLRIKLPSGRCLHYLKPELDESGAITYDTEDPTTRRRVRRRLYGSLLTENLVQAIARDVMAVGMRRAADAGFTIVGHTHDEILCLEPIDTAYGLTHLNRVMVDTISWCCNLPLKSEGWESAVYRK